MAQFFVSPGEPGIVEGNYKSWVHKWTHDVPDGVHSSEHVIFMIDYKNDILYLAWRETGWPNYARFGLYNPADFSEVFKSAAGAHYMASGSTTMFNMSFFLGNSDFSQGGLSRALETYVLLTRIDGKTIEVWRGGSSALWTHDIQNEVVNGCVASGTITITGKWILIYDECFNKLILYEGS